MSADLIKVLWADILDQCHNGRVGLCADIQSSGSLDGDVLEIDREVLKRLLSGRRNRPEDPSIAELATRAAEALGRWAIAGFKVCSEEQVANRLSICRSCEYFDEKARLGLGKCKAPGCGCTKLKLHLATESCPQGKWHTESNDVRV